MSSLALPVALLPDLGGGEFMLILFVVLLLFGGDKMPQLAKGIAKSLREFKKAAGDVEQEIKRAIDEAPDAPSLQTVIRQSIEDNKKPKPAPAAVTAPPVPAAPASTLPETPAPTSLSATDETSPAPPPASAHPPANP